MAQKPEIRRQIYHFLLLDPPDSFWYMQMSENKDPKKVCGTRTCIIKHGAMKEFDIRRFPAILCTNHQIYNEASSFFFATLQLHLAPAYVLGLALNSTSNASAPGSMLNPMLNLDGAMTPDTLAPFKRITFDIDFSFQFTWPVEALEAALNSRKSEKNTSLLSNTMPMLFVNENLTVDPDAAAKLLAFYKRSSVIRHFVNIVSNFPGLTRLVITLHASVFANYAIYSDPKSGPDLEGSDIGSDPNMVSGLSSGADDSGSMSRHGLMTAVANERATELLLDSGLLEPLEKLSNVLSFYVEFETQDRNGELYKPTAKHQAMLIALKQKIERNYSVIIS